MLQDIILLLLNFAMLANPIPEECSCKINSDQDFVKVKDHKIYYEKSGSGIAVLLIHGGYLDHTMWDNQVEFLNINDFMTIRFDDIGHGKSISGKEKVYSHEIIAALLNEVKIDRVHIVGLSWGAMVAMDYTLEYPEKVGKLLLMSPGLNGWEYFKDEKAKSNYKKRQQAQKGNNKNLFVEYFQKNWTDGPDSDSLRIDPEVRNKIGEIMKRNVENHWNEDWSHLEEDPPAIERIDDIKAETLIVTGNLDGKDIQMIAEKLDNDIRNSRRVEIKKVAHTLSLEKPRKTNRIILKVLKNQ
jgi:pimeloyl-ACP methyl ester carboxylesterase